jgi:SAM-dependent methyltransferase
VTRPDDFSFARYLAAKESVDDRALHRPTLDRVAADLSEAAARRDGPIRVLEVGCGLGSMLRRLLDWERLPDRVSYLGVDADGALVDAARERTREWGSTGGASSRPLVTSADGEGRPDDPFVLRPTDEADRIDGARPTDEADRIDGARPTEDRSPRVEVSFRAADAFDVAASDDRTWDLVIAAAFLDVVDPARALARFAPHASGVYAPITFDGVTAFTGGSDPASDGAVVDAYHATMHGPDRGGPRTGRALFDHVAAAGGRVRAAGGSDWVVHPPYPDDEAYFVHHVVDTVESAVLTAMEDGTDGGSVAVDRETVREWADDRHRAVVDGSLTYLAHNLDVYARF